MLTPDRPKSEKSLVVAPESPEIVLAEEGETSYAVFLPPLEDLREIAALKDAGISVEEISEVRAAQQQTEFRQELEREKAKLDRYEGSPTFLNRLAILAHAAGDRDQESHFLRLARAASKDSFFAHRQGDNLIALNRIEEAERIFTALDLETDIDANLKLAMLHVRDRAFDKASERVKQALTIDPLDFGARLFDGGLHLIAQQFQRAIHSLRIAAEERPTSVAAFTNMALAYMGLSQYERAISSLKRAVALGPLNANAVILLADLSFQMGRDHEALPSLLYFAHLEGRRASVWSRLARAYWRLGKGGEAAAALKHQASLEEDSSAVWNNLGVVYQLLRDRERAVKAYGRAIELGTPSGGTDLFVPARNLGHLLADIGATKELLAFTRRVLVADQAKDSVRDENLSDIYALHLYALRATGKQDEFTKIAEKVVASDSVAMRLRMWAGAVLAAQYALAGDQDKTRRLLGRLDEFVDRAGDIDVERTAILLNNIAFAHAEFGRLADAEKYMQRLSGAIHREPYPTATLGLIYMRKGQVERGTKLYQEAMRLAKRFGDKARIRQKLDFELGQYWSNIDWRRGARLLEKSANAREGEPALSTRAKTQLALLRARLGHA
jgi:tetratricopeptide (TPR) repeat protein